MKMKAAIRLKFMGSRMGRSHSGIGMPKNRQLRTAQMALPVPDFIGEPENSRSKPFLDQAGMAPAPRRLHGMEALARKIRCQTSARPGA